MTTLTDQQLLRDYAENRSEPAFAELVRRHIDLVYSAALRMVRDSHLAEDVTQGVFVALAKKAPQLIEHPVLSGWLHRTASNIAAQTVRTEVRRRNREQEAATMNDLISTGPDAVWEDIAPELDAALTELSDADRDVVMLRYFERKSAAEMAQVLGISDDAAQKRVNRAVDRLRESFATRGLAVGASGLAMVISGNAVQAAPVGLALTVSTAALTGTVLAATSTVTTAIVMTALQKTIITIVITVAVGVGVYEAHQAANLRTEVQTLRQQQEQQGASKAQVEQLQRERDDANHRLALLAAENAHYKKAPSDALKLRGEMGQLRQENASIKSTSPLNKITANPETRKFMREQQKGAMNQAYKSLAKSLKLTPEQTERFNDMLADYVMDNIDRTTEVLHDGTTGAAFDQVFDSEEAALLQKITTQLGADAADKYQTYNQDMVNAITTDQFSGKLTGTKEEKAAKKKQFLQAMQEESRAALTAAGLPADYQPLPLLDFRNIASEERGERTVQLLDSIYGRVTARAGSFLTPAELESFAAYRKLAVDNCRSALLLNRQLMAPIAK